MSAVTTTGREHMGRGIAVPTGVDLLAVCAVITLVAVLSYGETRTRDLAEDEAIVTKRVRSATRV